MKFTTLLATSSLLIAPAFAQDAPPAPPVPHPPHPGPEAVFSHLDQNKDGQISLEEFTRFAKPQAPPHAIKPGEKPAQSEKPKAARIEKEGSKKKPDAKATPRHRGHGAHQAKPHAFRRGRGPHHARPHAFQRGQHHHHFGHFQRSRAPFQAFRPLPFDRIDANHDGIVTKEEYQNALKNAWKQRSQTRTLYRRQAAPAHPRAGHGQAPHREHSKVQPPKKDEPKVQKPAETEAKASQDASKEARRKQALERREQIRKEAQEKRKQIEALRKAQAEKDQPQP